MKTVNTILFTNECEEPTTVSFETLGDKAVEYLKNEEGMSDEEIDTLFDNCVLTKEDGTTIWLLETRLIED